MKITFRKSWHKASIDVFVFEQVGNQTRWVKPCVLEFEDELRDQCSRLPDEPTFSIHPEHWSELKKSIQKELEIMGDIPEQSGLRGELKATKYHLEDMRKIAIQATTKYVEIK